VILAMLKISSTLLVLLLNKKLTYHPLHDDFPTSKDNFKDYFLLHPTPIKPAK